MPCGCWPRRPGSPRWPCFRSASALDVLRGARRMPGYCGPAPGLRDPATLATFIWSPVSYPYFERYRDAHQTVASAAAVLDQYVRRGVHWEQERASGTGFRTPGFARVFHHPGCDAGCGTGIRDGNGEAGMAPVVVVSDRFWRTHLGADPQAVGRGLRLNGSMATIVASVQGFSGYLPRVRRICLCP